MNFDMDAFLAAYDEGTGVSVGEQQVNEALCALNEAHRMRRIQRDEYRRRRRELLESLESLGGGSHAAGPDTVRRAVPSGGPLMPRATGQRHDGGNEDVPASIADGFGVRLLATCAALLGVVAACVLMIVWMASRP